MTLPANAAEAAATSLLPRQRGRDLFISDETHVLEDVAQPAAGRAGLHRGRVQTDVLAQGDTDGDDEVVHRDRLAEIRRGAGSQRVLTVLPRVAPAHHDHGHAGQLGQRVHALHDHGALAAGKADVEDDHAGLEPHGGAHGGDRVERHGDLVAALAKPPGQGRQQVPVVVDQQDHP